MAKVIKEKFTRSKPHCNIGTIGHVDHGKTTLTAAITKVLALKDTNTKFKSYHDIDSNVEERTRGITINASHVEYETENRHYSHIDCPGHQHYIKNMITGATQMEGVILVVAVTEGPQEQTREHIILAKEIGIPYMVVYVNKMDALKEKEMKDLVEIEIRELVSSYSFPDDLPLIFGSARTALEENGPSRLGYDSIVELMSTVDSYIKQPERPVDSPFLMPVESGYSISGRGTVLTGKIEQGKIKLNDEIEILNKKIIKTFCTGLEMYRKVLEYAEAGENVGILVKGVPLTENKRKNVGRGDVVAAPGTLGIYDAFEAKAYILEKKEGGRSKPFSSNYKPQFFFRTANVTGTVTLPEDSIAMPGDTITFTVKFDQKIPLNEGLRFALREGSLTIGAGIVTRLPKKVN